MVIPALDVVKGCNSLNPFSNGLNLESVSSEVPVGWSGQFKQKITITGSFLGVGRF
jgi:hypothetical protein